MESRTRILKTIAKSIAGLAVAVFMGVFDSTIEPVTRSVLALLTALYIFGGFWMQRSKTGRRYFRNKKDLILISVGGLFLILSVKEALLKTNDIPIWIPIVIGTVAFIWVFLFVLNKDVSIRSSNDR